MKQKSRGKKEKGVGGSSSRDVTAASSTTTTSKPGLPAKTFSFPRPKESSTNNIGNNTNGSSNEMVRVWG